MAKKIEVKNKLEDVEMMPRGNPILDQVAFSIVKTGEKLYSVYRVDFNTEGCAGNVKVVAPNLDLFEAQYQFKVAVTDAGLFNILDKVQ